MDGVSLVKRHIQLGDIYELNFCQEFFAENCAVDDYLAVYRKLNNITKAPFSAYFNWQNFAVFCGSPERFLQKKNNRLLSQPIKGTAPRNENESRDLQLKNQLQNDPKERAENIMIVDLVRNDLSRIAVTNSVQVDELCEIYSFETVHQMISTVSCTVEDSISFKDIVKATFPMGSMTGAPKLRAMELIDKYEAFNRGLYAGSIGYIHPNGDFDFNVVIRTVLYNATKKYLSCSVGGAITIQSDPEKEYEECLVKVKRILDGLNA
jgi:para-aminobenzoate synthetase component 1